MNYDYKVERENGYTTVVQTAESGEDVRIFRASTMVKAEALRMLKDVVKCIQQPDPTVESDEDPTNTA